MQIVACKLIVFQMLSQIFSGIPFTSSLANSAKHFTKHSLEFADFCSPVTFLHNKEEELLGEADARTEKTGIQDRGKSLSIYQKQDQVSCL